MNESYPPEHPLSKDWKQLREELLQDIPVLNGKENYDEWAAALQKAAENAGIWKLITGEEKILKYRPRIWYDEKSRSEKRPLWKTFWQEKRDCDYWELGMQVKMAMRAKDLLTMSLRAPVGNKVLDAITHAMETTVRNPTPNMIWQMIRKDYHIPPPVEAQVVFRKMCDLHLKDHVDMWEYIHSVQEMLVCDDLEVQEWGDAAKLKIVNGLTPGYIPLLANSITLNELANMPIRVFVERLLAFERDHDACERVYGVKLEADK